MAKSIGYARVSTTGQTLDAQVEALEAAGAEAIFRETASGARTDRAQLAKAIGALRTGDTLIVTRLDRLARSTRDLLNILDAVAKKSAMFKSLVDTWADTTTPQGRLLLTVLGGLAEFERELIKARTGEGRRRAVESGVKLGRRSSLTLINRPRSSSAGRTAKASWRWQSPTGSRIRRLFGRCGGMRQSCECGWPASIDTAGGCNAV
jgi:DNA invertase Pin-like site-specific DNA recombinase